MDVISLRNALETALVEVLGTYRLVNGGETPAVSVRSEGDGLPAGTRVSGIECVIIRDPDLVPIGQYEGQQAFSRWTVYLVNWDADLDLGVVAQQLLTEWPGSGLSLVPTRRQAGPRSMYRVTIQTNPEAEPEW